MVRRSAFLLPSLLGLQLALSGACAPEPEAASPSTAGSPLASSLFATGFEPGEPPPTWNDSPESVIGVSGYFAGLAPECSPRSEVAHAGTRALMFSGTDDSATRSYVYFKVFQVSLPVSASTRLSYWLYPQNANAVFVGVDLHFTDGSVLRDSSAVDGSGCPLHPAAGHCSRAPVNQWTLIESDIGRVHAGKIIDRISVAYDQAPGTGPFRGFIDDIALSDSGGPEWSMFSIPTTPVPSDVCGTTKVRQATLEMSWREAEPQEGVWNSGYFQHLRHTQNGGRISVYHPGTLAFIRSWDVARAGRLSLDPSGNLWVLQRADATNAPRALKFSPTGGSPLATITFAAGVTPTDLTVDGTGRILVTDNGPDQNVKIYSPTNLSGTPTAVSSVLGTPGGVFSTSGGLLPGVAGPGRFYAPSAVAVDGSGTCMSPRSTGARLGWPNWAASCRTRRRFRSTPPLAPSSGRCSHTSSRTPRT